MPDSIRVLISDDHLVVREGLRLILESEEGFQVVGEASNGLEAVRQADELQPDVILMDLRMPEMDGLEAIERIRARWPGIAIVILTTFNEDELMVRGLKLGASGYLLKDTGRAALFESVRAAVRGETLLSSEIMARLLARAAEPVQAQRRTAGTELTERELQVLQAVARGERCKEIGARLGITERTVKAHLDSIYNKLGVDSRAAAVSEATRRGLL